MKHKAKNKKKDINHASLPKVFARTCSRCINRSVLHVLAFLEQNFNSYISLLKNLFLCNVSGMPLSRDIFILCKHPDLKAVLFMAVFMHGCLILRNAVVSADDLNTSFITLERDLPSPSVPPVLVF